MNGEYGFKVKRRFPSSFEYDIGDVVMPQDAIKIPIRNRIALERAGLIEFLAEPADASLQIVIDKQAKEIEALKAEIETLKSGNGKGEEAVIAVDLGDTEMINIASVRELISQIQEAGERVGLKIEVSKSKREALEQRAGELGIKFRKNTPDEKLESDIQEKEQEAE